MKPYAHIAFFATLAAPGVALAASAPQNFKELANQIASLFSSATIDIIVLAIVIYFWGISASLLRSGEKDRENLKKQLLWGVLVIFFAVSIWGIIQIIQGSVFGQGVDATNGTGGGGTPIQACTGLNCSSPFGGN